MAESSPGNHGSRKSSATVVDGTSSHSQPSSLLLSEDHFGSTVPSDHPSVYANKFINGLQFRIRNSQEKCPSFTYASVPGVAPTPLEWKMCCDPDSDVGSEHVTFHQLTDSDESLTIIIERYVESNAVGLIIINSTESLFLSDDFKGRYVPSTPPVYIISSGDGEKLRRLVEAHDEGVVLIKVLVESAVDSLPASTVPVYPPSSNRYDTLSSKADTPSTYNLHDELKKHLFVNRKERIHACASQPEFQFMFSCFHNYEIQPKRDPPEKAMKMLEKFTDEAFNKDFLFYLMLGHRFITHSDKYGHNSSSVISSYLVTCIEKFETMNDVQALANTIMAFIQRGDFIVQFSHGAKSDVSVFQLLYNTATVMLTTSSRLQEEKLKVVKNVLNVAYRRILWTALIIYFGLQVKIEPSILASYWEANLLNEQVQRGITFSTDVVKEFAKGFEMMKALQIPESVCFDYSGLGIFLNPSQMRALYLSHITTLLKAGESYLNWGLTFLCHFLPPLRCNYDNLLAVARKDWRRYSEDGTKIGLYKEALKFLEYVYDRMLKLNKNEEDSKRTDVIGIEIKKWIELLVNSVNMKAGDAVQYFKELKSNKAFGKKYNKILTASIQTKGMKIVTQLTMGQFFMLFADLLIWKFEFVENFLNHYVVPMTTNLSDPSWKQLLEEIVDRFSDPNCKKCVVGLLDRVGKAYKSGNKHKTFIMDLMKLDTPYLLFVKSPRDDDPKVDQLFMEMVRMFIQKNALRETLLIQVPGIMKLVKADSHFQNLILTVMQKEVAPDSKMIEKLNSSNQLKSVIDASVKAASSSFNRLSRLSEVDKFYWHFIASCCAQVQLNVENLSRLKSYVFATEKLSKIYCDYWSTKNMEKPPACHEVSQEISRLNSDVKEYFKWIVKMQKIMAHWQSKFFDEEFTYDDIFAYHENLPTITAFATAVYTDHLVYSDADIIKFRESYSNVYANLCLLLVKSNKEYGWCTLVEILNSYGIKLSHSLQTKLDTHLVLPGRSVGITEDDVQQRLNQSNSQIELEPEMILLLKKSMTWKVLKEIFNDLQSFLEPIASQFEFLVYFHMHNCEMFSKHLKSQIAKISAASSDQPIEESSIILTLPTVSTQQSSTDPDEKLKQFATALQHTRDFILSLIKGTATYAEIFAEGSLEESIQKFDAEREFEIMSGFSEFQEISEANKEGKRGIKHMLELFQYSHQILKIPEVCSQYHLQRCLSDPKLIELEEIVKSVQTPEDRAKVTGQIANNHMKKIWEVLSFADPSIAKKCLKIFPAVANCAEFYQFIQKKGFVNDRTAFSSQLELITAQLQHEDYNETVLNHLLPAFQYITPFLDQEQSLGELMNKIIKLFNDGVGFGRDSRKDFCQLETVNSNITMIQLWFSRTEGDTLENVSTELDCIMETGCFNLVVNPKRIAGTTRMDYEASAEHNSGVHLYYEPAMTSFLHRRRVQAALSESHDEITMPVTPPPLGRQYSCVAETWNNEQIDDFVRKLGFLEAQSTDVEQKVKLFQQLNQTAQKFYQTLLKLRDLGHPEYVETIEKIYCSDKLESVEAAESKVIKAEEKLKSWNTTIRNMHNSYDKLLFFSVSKVLSLYDILSSPAFSVDEMIQEVGFLFENDPGAIKKLKTAIKGSISDADNTLSFSKETTPVAHVGRFLVKLCSGLSVSEHFLHSRSQPSTSIKGKSVLSFQEVVHFAPNYDNGQLLRLLIEIYNGVPESFEVFQCDENSTEEDLKLFLSRASKFRYRTFTILGVNTLPYKLQEIILQQHSQEAEQSMESAIRLNYIETATSILHEMPWVVVKEYKENGPELKWDAAKNICSKYVNKRSVNFELILVYGHAGDGKTHYIKTQLHEAQHSLVIAVNESFCPLNAILKLRSLTRDERCDIFFNFTIVPSNMSTMPEEQIKYKKLMNTLAWFFFKLLVFEYVEDSETGMAFRLPGGHQWRIFIEVPSLSEVTQGDAKQHLEWIYNEIPIFRLLGKPVPVEKEKPYDINPSVQLVCKYLRAYKNQADLSQGINRLFTDNSPPVKFGDDPNLTAEECHSLLRDYMPGHVTKNKVLQQLFIKYMERRCKFMESFPGFCYNSGCGTLYDHTRVESRELMKMVKDKVLVRLTDNKTKVTRYYSNTSQLGQVLMETMIKEVSEFCKINIQQSWATQAHQQLIYEVRSGAGTIQLLTLKPEELNKEITKKFEVLGIEIPDMKELRSREKLDGYLSSALGVPLKDGRLQDIDEAKYVLTLDYTVKMLNIHERRECGIPVIIEGETGVGKTALINMLSKLWNHALISQWRGVKGRITEMLHHKSLDMDNTDLPHTLQKLSTEWQYDKDSEITDKVLSEEELLPLTEMTHSLQEGDSIPFYEYINRRLLEMSNSESILGLLDVDVEMKDEQYRDRLLSFSNRKTSAVSYLIDNEMHSPSAQGTAKLLCKLLNGNLVPTFYKLNIHAALSPKKIQEFFIPIVKLAKYLLKIHKAKQIKGMNEPPVVTVFLDEVNTSSCMGLFKEIIIDKTFEGEPLPPNIFLVAACNPHRGNSLAVHENKDEHKAETWVRGSYYVQKLHPTLQFLMWDYGSLNHEQEAAYVQSKMIMVNEDFDIVQNVVFSELVVNCQNLIRKFAFQQLKHFGMEDKEAKLRATSCVSQRDIQRVFTFYGWISKTYEMLQMPTTEGGVVCISKHPMIKERLSIVEEMRQRALLVALGLVYYMRLDSEYREEFSKELDKMHFAVKFQTAFTQEMDFYTNELSLPTGIAKTEALKENLFATIICTVTKTPLIIVGAPGSSKTLSFNLTISNLKGPESKQKLFRNTDVFKSLDPHYYQCSRRTTSTEIETVFLRAINRQRSHKNFSMPIRCVVFMDEAGLPEESHESLKVLHYHLDQQEVAFVAITNHILDAAKTNRAVSLFRPTASQKDLETLAKGCLCANPERPPPELEGDLRTIVKFCPAYYSIMQDERFEKFFGLRDFIHFINYIRRERAVDITPELVLQSLERNFNGTTKGFDHICSVFLEKVGATLEGLKQRSIIEILRNSLADKPYVSQTTTNKVMASSLDDTQNEVRYKLIIDPSEDESITRLLFMFDILKRDNTRSYMCSDFLGDGQLQKINTIAAIRHSAIAGHTVIMSQTDDIHESFYDLFNQHFRRIDDPEGGPRYFTNIAIGAHLKPSRVDQNFQCIVVVKESEIKNTPAPFLNRFEKYYISHTNLLNLVLKELPPCLKVIINVVYKKVETFYSLLGESSFYGGNKETVCSLLLSILPKPGHKYKPITQSFVPTDSEVDDGNFTDGSFSVIKEGSSNKVLLLQNVVRCLHELGGFCYMESSQKELEHDANCIIDLLAKAGSEFSGVAETLGSCDIGRILQWITEAMDLIYTGEAPPDIDTPDYDMCNDDDDDDDDNFKTLGASDGACMVTAVIAQWLVRYSCKKLMQLMTPEAAILKRKSIPISYLETYLNYQTHFSIKELITRQSELLNQCGDGTIATKLICYTRSTPSIHQLPAMYPRTTFSSAEELQQSNGHVEHLICDKVDNVFLCKLSAISSQTAFKLQLHAFEASQRQNVFVLIINMQDTSRLIINHIRIMIEEAERTKTEIKKLFVLLLHFPAMMFYEPCYPSLFLQGWDHYYLDAIDRTNISTLVDTREWFRQSCLTAKEVSAPTAAEEIKPLLALLKKQESILVIASRILLNIDSNEVSLDSLPDISTKASYLKKLLFDKKVAHILCLKFKSYWRSSVMGDHLEQAAKFSKSRESTLNVSDSVDSIYKSSFFNFIAFMIYQMSKGRNLDMLFSGYCDNAALDLFLKLLDVHPIPKLSEIKAFNNTWDCRVHTAGKTGYIPQFPFFVEVSAYICNMVEQSVGEINKIDDILQEKAKPDVVDLQSKEQMLKKLYEHLCDRSSAIIKAEKTVGEKYMSAIAIKEMGNDEALWQKYFNDFTHQYLHLSTTTPDNIESRLVQLTFTSVLRKYSVMKAITVHCYMFLYQLDLAKIVASLKPLGQLEELKGNEQSLYPGDTQGSVVTTFQTLTLGSSSVSKFVIDSLFSVLVNVIYSKDKTNRLSLLQKWYNSYRDMMSMASLKSMLTVAMLTEQLKTQHHLMKVTFLVLQSFHHITNIAAECACTFASYLFNKCFDDKFQFKGDVSLNLKEIVTSFHIMLQSPQFTKVVTMSQLYQHIMEGLFAHFFPDTGNSKAVYSKEDIKFFLTFANEQDKQKAYSQLLSQDDQSANSISLSKFKFHLDRILCKGWSKSEIVAKPLTFYKLEVCICVGETILSQHPETSLSKYIPLYLQQATKTDQLKLMHLYFYTVLERLHTSQFTPTQLLKMVTDTEKKLTDTASSKAENLMAVVERQALLEALLQSIVNDFDLENKTKLTKLSTIADQINNLVNEQSHYDILLMYLMKKHHGVQGVLNVLAEKHRKLWEPLICLRIIKEKLKSSPPSTVHQFPFIVGGPTTEHQFNIIYRDLCNQLHGIAPPGSPTERAKTFLLSIVNSSDKSYDGKSVVRMMIWLCVYYEFYCKKKQSTNLMKFFKEMERELEFSKEHLNVLSCFLDCKNMKKIEEVPNPLNPNAEVLEYTKDGKIRPKQPPSNVPKSDPIWELFNLKGAREDPSDVDLRNALANMIAVVFGLPSYSTHLWYHMFCPGDLENSYMTGFMYPKVVKRGTLMYDCGCELNEDGNYGRSDYSSRDTLSLHSWYLLLWCNFGAFCIGLLTQPTALEQLKGRILSDWMSIRHYCMTQLRTVWLHMRTNMSFGDEERSFFIMSSMYQLFMLFQQQTFPYPQGKFGELSALADYEKAWHKLVYEFSKADLKNKLENHSSHSVWALPILKTFRALEQHYPHPATESDYMNSLVDATEANDCSYTHVYALHQFTLEQRRLQVGGALLSDLVEFYQWIHTQLSHLVTYQRAKQITVGNVISLTAKRYSQELCDNLTKLFKRIIDKFNDYLRVTGGVVGGATCNRAVKPTDVHPISKDTPLIYLVSLEDTNKNDWLYLVLMDVIGNHNAFLNNIFAHALHSDCHYKKYLPDNPPELHLTEVTDQSCIVPADGPDGKQFLKLINSHYVYNVVQSSAMFDLVQLEQDVVKFYIAGKPLIAIDDGIRTVFRFRNSPTENTLPGNNPGCATDLSAIAQELPNGYKESLRDDTKKNLEFHFRTASYHTFTEVVDGLRTVMGHLIQGILQRKDKAWDPTMNTKLFDYLKKFFSKDHHKVFDEVGIPSINDTQCKLLGDIEMKRLFKCLGLFVGWLQGGFYDFNSLPISFLKHLSHEDLDAVMRLHLKYSSTGMDRLLTELDEFEKTLNHAEIHLTTVVEHKLSIIQCLVELGLCDAADKFVSFIPKSILVCHYVHFRMALRKLKLSVTAMTHSQAQNSEAEKKWTEIIEDLWKHLPHFQDEEELYDDHCLKFDCVALQFGDGEESDSDSETWLHQNTADMEDSFVAVNETKEDLIERIKQDPELKRAVMETLAPDPVTPSLATASVTAPSVVPSLVAVPSDKAMAMSTEELCQWLKDRNIADTYIECFREENVDGAELAAYDDNDLKQLGISEPRIRKKIMIQFRKIS